MSETPEEPSLFGSESPGLRLGDPPPPAPEHVKLVLPRDSAPGAGDEPGDVASEVRQAFLFSPDELGDAAPAGSRRPVELGRVGAPTEGRPLPPTGIFRRPVPPPPPEPEPEADAEADANDIPLSMRIRAWMAGLEWNGRMVIGVACAFILAMLLGVWSARGCRGGDADPLAGLPPPEEVDFVADVPGDAPNAADEVTDASALAPVVQEVPPVVQTPPPVVQTPPAEPAKPDAPAAPQALPEWTLPHAIVKASEGSLFITFDIHLFESKDLISKDGMACLKAVAAKLHDLSGGAAVVVTGYTDNTPPSKPSGQFRTNADIAAARAETAVDHLRSFAKNKALSFEARPGPEAEAPWPNDTPEHRRLNRTVRIQVTPMQKAD